MDEHGIYILLQNEGLVQTSFSRILGLITGKFRNLSHVRLYIYWTRDILRLQPE